MFEREQHTQVITASGHYKTHPTGRFVHKNIYYPQRNDNRHLRKLHKKPFSNEKT